MKRALSIRPALRLSLLALAGLFIAPHAMAQDCTSEEGESGSRDNTSDFLVSPRVGLASDDLRGHELVTTKSPAVTVGGLSVVGRVPCELADAIPFVHAGNYALSLTGGATEGDGVRSERVAGEVFVMAPTNQYFGFAMGYRYERALDEFIVQPPTGVGSVETQLHSVRAGFSGTLPIFTANKSRMFSALYLAGGAQLTRTTDVTAGDTKEDSFFFGPEVVIGYAVDISDNLTFDVRYRTALYVADLSGASEAQTQNGVFASLGYRF